MPTGVDCTPDRGTEQDIDAAAFLDELGDTPSLECTTEEEKRAGPGFILAQYRPGATSKYDTDLADGSSTELLCFDVDSMGWHDIGTGLALWEQVDCVMYSTWKHSLDSPRFRVIVRLSRAISTGDEFDRVYAVAAASLGIAYDSKASRRANFYLSPQHRPGANGSTERHRFRGQPLDVDALLRSAPAVAARAPAFEGPGYKPEIGQVRGLARRVRGGVGASLEAVLRGERYAADGSLHEARKLMSWALVREWPTLDGEWFAETYLHVCWAKMPGAGIEVRTKDWLACVDSAARKRDAPAAAVVSAPEGGLVCEFRGSYYVYNKVAAGYEGPLKSTGLPAACKRAGVPYLTEKGGLRSGPALVADYGTDLVAVNYHAMPPAEVFDAGKRAIHLPAYQWNEWDPVWHDAADELLHAIGGTSYNRLEAWLYKLRDLAQPLPALTLVGARGTWKSALARTISRHWGSRSVATPCAASQVLLRFSAPLLNSPVVLSEETACKEAGPERYRESITGMSHAIECKGVDPVWLFGAVRHIMCLNNPERAFLGDIASDEVEATMERYLMVETDAAAVARFEEKWAGTSALDGLREGTLLLQHIAWIATHTVHEPEGRLFVGTNTNPEILIRARFADDTLTRCLLIAIESLVKEADKSVPNQTHRMALLWVDGQLRMSPARIVELWDNSTHAKGSGIRKPNATKVGILLQQAGLKARPGERASKNKYKAWEVQKSRLREFVTVGDFYTWEQIEELCGTGP